jgi:two-component system sensor histidine kinase HydH
LRELINSTVALIAGEARERGVDLNVEAISDATLTGSQAGALREALSNLVINAVQAMESGGAVTIETGIEADKRSNSRLVLTVTDTGPGISEETQQKVFEPFYSTKSRGTGLGLAIVQRRTVELGGMVELTSPVKDNQGSRFRLVIPFAPEEKNLMSGA